MSSLLFSKRGVGGVTNRSDIQKPLLILRRGYGEAPRNVRGGASEYHYFFGSGAIAGAASIMSGIGTGVPP